MKNIEGQVSPKKPSIMESGAFQRFVKFRDINSEDFGIIEELSKHSTGSIAFSVLHNFFSSNKENSERYLEMKVSETEDISKKELYGLMLKFAQKYDWHACHNLIRLLEGEISD